ncbi:MerR family DNA-binding transcriptional regulator [Lentibacillus sp. L22]|uniref:recombinase family protein n=2 Tax=Lentibacillus TaxID=175304 RepID=UPI00346718F2
MRRIANMYTIDEASSILGVHPTTLRRWEKERKITSSRTTGGHRRYAVKDLSAIKRDLKPLQDKIVIGYCRVSSSDQKEELKRQVHTVSQYCSANGYQFRFIKDLGSGMLSIITVFSSRLYGSRSHKRKKLQQAVKQVIEDNGHAYV